MIPQGSNQQMVLEETESPARKLRKKPQQVLGISCHFEGSMQCTGHMCWLLDKQCVSFVVEMKNVESESSLKFLMKSTVIVNN